LVRNPVELRDGFAEVPQEPGLGVDVNPETLNKFLVRK
jgi:L-alanine-DL-glutamate epimerase-like enolase superfamily enzyme